MRVVTARPEVLAPRQFGATARVAGANETFGNTPSTSSGSYALTEAADAAATG